MKNIINAETAIRVETSAADTAIRDEMIRAIRDNPSRVDAICAAAGNTSLLLLSFVDLLISKGWHYASRSASQLDGDAAFGVTIMNFRDEEGDLSINIADGTFVINYYIGHCCGQDVSFNAASGSIDFDEGLAKAMLSARLAQKDREYVGAKGNTSRITIIKTEYHRLIIDFGFNEPKTRQEAWDFVEALGLLRACLGGKGYLHLTSRDQGKNIEYEWFYGE